MDKLEMMTKSLSQENIEKIRALFPNAVTEIIKDGKVELAVDFDVLKQELSDTVIEAGQERYQMTWPDKRKAVALASSSISATLRPCREESVEFDTTQNLYIEGDNLDVLKLLRETYHGKVKMIYIDPPYNTGNDFVYEDDFAQSAEEYAGRSGQYDEQGKRLFQNTESNGRFHTDWLNMIYPRLKLARDLLSDDGVIFISIDDNEQANLKKVCDEIFGENCFVADLIWQKKFSRSNDATYFSTMHDHILCYCKKNILIDDHGWKIGLLPRDEQIPSGYSNPDNDPRGVWASVILSAKSGSSSLLYEITTPSGRKVSPPSGRYWSCSKENFEKLVADNRIWFGASGDGIPRKKTFLSEVQAGLRPNTILFQNEAGNNQEAKQETKALFDGVGVFDGPKPVRLLELLCIIANFSEDDILLDFFSGSATSAHAVMQLNAKDRKHRKFIMVQLPEKCDEKSEAYKAGYKTICEIGKERIRRAGKKIKEQNNRISIYINAIDEIVKDNHIKTEIEMYIREVNEKWIENEDDPEVEEEIVRKRIIDIINSRDNLLNDLSTYEQGGDKLHDLVLHLVQEAIGLSYSVDTGFRVLKLDSSNMQDVFYNPAAMTQDLLSATIDNVKPDRTPMDLLFQIMLELGVQLSAKIEEKEISGKKYYIVNDNEIIACFDDNLNNDVITDIAKRQPIYAAFKGSSFATDSASINCEQLFKTYSPATDVKVI